MAEWATFQKCLALKMDTNNIIIRQSLFRECQKECQELGQCPISSFGIMTLFTPFKSKITTFFFNVGQKMGDLISHSFLPTFWPSLLRYTLSFPLFVFWSHLFNHTEKSCKSFQKFQTQIWMWISRPKDTVMFAYCWRRKEQNREEKRQEAGRKMKRKRKHFFLLN